MGPSRQGPLVVSAGMDQSASYLGLMVITTGPGTEARVIRDIW